MYGLDMNLIKFIYNHIKHDHNIQMSYNYYKYHWSTYVNVDYSQHGGNKN